MRYPPLKRGISAILARYPLKTRQMGAIPPSAILSRKGIARYGGVSRTGPLRSRFCVKNASKILWWRTPFGRYRTSILTNSLLCRASSRFKGARTAGLVEHCWVPLVGASCSNKLSVVIVQPSEEDRRAKTNVQHRFV